MLAGNTAPWLFNRTQYANGLGSTSSTTQLHADSNGNLVATVASEGGTAKADSLLLYSAYGSVDSEASGNAGTGIRSNGHSFGSYYADPETGLLYARARYYDPASGQFISRDPVEGEARLPITWGAYQYGRYNPYRYVDPNGEQSTSTMIDNAAEGCGRFTCTLYALGNGDVCGRGWRVGGRIGTSGKCHQKQPGSEDRSKSTGKGAPNHGACAGGEDADHRSGKSPARGERHNADTGSRRAQASGGWGMEVGEQDCSGCEE
ncbi:RHS repeat-associated core domain-containing protein [Delftia acidovorans]